jgi:hypothetical protein
MEVGPNAQAVVDRLAGRPAAIIAAEPDSVQKVFSALFTGAFSPASTDAHAVLTCGSADAEAGWPRAWLRLQDLGLIHVATTQKAGKTIMVSQAKLAWCDVRWQITPKGWEVHMDDAAWMLEYRAADESDKATKQ